MMISWVTHHGRSAGIAHALGIEPIFLPEGLAGKSLIQRYVASGIFTYRALGRSSDGVIVIMLPPAPLLALVRILRPRTEIIADLHTGFFSDPKWRWSTKLCMKLLQGSLAIVTNMPLQERCRSKGISAIILHDFLRNANDGAGKPSTVGQNSAPTVVCPLSYANDEPVAGLLEAARLSPDVNFFLTGRPPNSIRAQAPSNVTFTGYLSNGDYDQLLNRSDVVMALTTRDLTMQRAGYEAFMAGKPQVTSGFTTLKDFYEDCAVYVEPAEPGSIAAGVREALQRTDELSKRAHRVADARLNEQAKQLEWLDNYVRAPKHVKRTMRLELKEGG